MNKTIIVQNLEERKYTGICAMNGDLTLFCSGVFPLSLLTVQIILNYLLPLPLLPLLDRDELLLLLLLPDDLLAPPLL